MKNAKITSASLGLDNGAFIARIYVMGDSFGGSFYVVGLAESWITGVLNCAGVDAWEDLTGEMIRVEDPVCGSTIERITHITDDEIYFDAKEWMAGPGAAAARARAANGVKLPRPKLSTPDHDDVQDASSVAHDHLRPDVEVSTKSETVKRLKKLGDLTLGVAKTRRQNLWAGDLRDTDSFTVGFWDGRLWALARLASILSASQRTQARELLGITESEWSEIPEPGFKPLSRDDLVDTCWTIAVDGSESSTMRAKAIDALVELVAR